ncbi:MAG TPA: YceI family protein [Acidimicrobiales bacterium]|jgi:polyisoprenoid-binding protein YceI|nr:YceI family protein [Acidimicrobiales bacterium]
MAATLREYQGLKIPEAGTYSIDPAHTTVEFVGRHLMITKVRGRFTDFSGEIVIGDKPEDSKVDVTVQTASVSTSDENRDGHLRGPDFLDVEKYPTMTFHSTAVTLGSQGKAEVTGDLTIKDVTRPVTLDVEFEGAEGDPWGGQRLGFSAGTEIDREDWGLTWNVALETGGMLVGKKIRLELNIQAVKQ